MHQRTVRGALALGMLLILAAPAAAFELVFGNTVRLRWEASAGDVDHYGVWLGTKAQGFPKKPLYRSKTPQVQIPAIFLGNLQVRVAAFDSRGRRGPFSPISDPFRFAEADENSDEMTCQGQQLGALGRLCKAQLQCEAANLGQPDEDRREGCLSKASFEFAVRYEQALARSDCRMTEPTEEVLGDLRSAAAGVVAGVSEPGAQQMLVSAGRLCRRGFRTERRYHQTLDIGKRNERRDRQRDLFIEATDHAKKGTTEAHEVADLIDGLIDHWVGRSRPLVPAVQLNRIAF